MALDTSSARSRRSLLTAALGAAAATAVAAVTPREAVDAANGDNLVIGQTNTATGPTVLTGSAGDTIAALLRVESTYGAAIVAQTSSTISGAALQATGPVGGINASTSGSSSFPGVTGQGNPGIRGTGFPVGSAGVVGIQYGIPVPTSLAVGTGVYGESGDATGVQGVSGGATGVLGQSKDQGTGVQGFSGPGTPPVAPSYPIGVYGEASGTDATGVWGDSSSADATGVYGEGAIGVWGFGGWGVFGASDAGGTGVYGFSGASVPSSPAHTGVFGYSDSGTGVYALAATGTALYVNGKAKFSRSGRVAITAGHSSVSKSLAGVTTSSLIFAVMQTRRTGYYLVAAVPTSGKFTVYLNKTVSGTTYVAYFVVN